MITKNVMEKTKKEASWLKFAKANKLSPDQLQQTLTFFESDAGKKYTLAQAEVLNALGASGAAWRQQLTTVMLNRTREEMKKKGFNF